MSTVEIAVTSRPPLEDEKTWLVNLDFTGGAKSTKFLKASFKRIGWIKVAGLRHVYMSTFKDEEFTNKFNELEGLLPTLRGDPTQIGSRVSFMLTAYHNHERNQIGPAEEGIAALEYFALQEAPQADED